MSRFEDCLDFVFQWEGGFSNDKNDHGGATNFGITQSVYSTYCEKHNLPAQAVKLITKEEAEAIYLENYWRPVCADAMASPLDLVLFDSAVNCGVRQASKWLQRAVKVTPDGAIGRITLAACRDIDPVSLATAVVDQRQDFYNDIVEKTPTQGKFLNGWLNRVAALRKELRHGN